MLLFTFQEVLVVVTGGEVLWCGKEVGAVVWASLSRFRRFGLLLCLDWVASVEWVLGCCCWFKRVRVVVVFL